jgi:hypothetical protein
MGLGDAGVGDTQWDDAMNEEPNEEPKRYRTKSGTILTEEDLARLADEAERGYCTALVSTDDFTARCFRPMPCPVHGPDPDPEQEQP